MRKQSAKFVIVAGIALLLTGAAAANPGERWAGAWGYAPATAGNETPRPAGTYRYRVRLTQQGTALMLTFSNAEGDRPVTIGQATVALPQSADGVEIDATSVRPLTFSRAAGDEIDVGGALLSDALPFAAKVGQDIIVSVTFTTPTKPSGTDIALPVGFAPSDAPDHFQAIRVRPYLSLVSVQTERKPCAIVAFGDSITDGAASTSPTIRGWPGVLAERLAAQSAGRRCGVVNLGIGGNRVLRNGHAVNALDRFWRDVASVPGATDIILLEGINDIGVGGSGGDPFVTPDALVAGYRQIVARAHALGLRVIGGTLTPAEHAFYITPAKERTRRAVNDEIRSGTVFDAVIDFDKAVRDPIAPGSFRAGFDPGDHLHPNDAGYKAMGDAIDLGLFR